MGAIAACSSDGDAPQPALEATRQVPIDTIFAYDTIFGPDEVVVASSYPEGCNKLRQITLERSADRVSFAAHYDFFEPCQPGATVFDQDRAWHPAGADMTWIDIDYPGFSGPGRYFLAYQAPGNRAVAIPITVLPASTLSSVVLMPTPPATLAAGDSLKVRFQYSTPVNGAIAVFMYAFDASSNNVFHTTCPSPVFGTGTGISTACVFAPGGGSIDTVFLRMERVNVPRRLIAWLPVPARFTFVPR